MVRIRLSRIGAKKRPFYRIVVTDARRARSGRSKEVVGTYDPLTDPATISIPNPDRVLYWLSVGAQPTEKTRYLLEESGVWAEFLQSKGKEVPARAPRKAVSAPVSEEPAEGSSSEEADEASAGASLEETAADSEEENV